MADRTIRTEYLGRFDGYLEGRCPQEVAIVDTAGNDETPLFVPDEFQSEHLDDARRTVTRSRARRQLARQVTKAASWRGGQGSPHPRLRGLAYLLHALAAVLALAFAAITSTWFVGLAVVVFVGLSLATVLRVLVVIERAQLEEAQKQPR